MLPDSAWSTPCNKSELKFSSENNDWKNFMNDCLMGTEIFKKNHNENDICLPVDPNFVMDVRHKMVKQSTKIIPLPQVLIHAEALKLLRIENQKKLLRQKEGKMVEKEIDKLKQMLENHRLFTKQQINEATTKKLKYLSNLQKFPKHKKLCKILSSHNDVNIWKWQPVQMKIKSQTSENFTLSNFKISSKLEEHWDEFSEPVSNQKGSIIENERECENQFCEIYEGKKELMKRFLEKKIIKVKLESQCSEKESEKIREIPSTENLVDQKRMEHAWNNWKTYTQKVKSRKREEVIYKNKIENFLMKLEEKEKNKQNGDITNLKAEFRVNTILKNRGKQVNPEKDKRLEKMMKEIKMSQSETYQKLKEIRMNSLGNRLKLANAEFLRRMEDRRAERLKRRKEIEEKKRKIEEEKEKAHREKEEEKRRQEEEYKRKNVEAFKEKRKLEKEKKEERKKVREKLRLNMKLAESHYEKYVLHRCGLRPWKALVKLRNSQNQLALAFFETRLKQKVFCEWASNAREQVTFRFNIADAFYEKVLKRKILCIWVFFQKEKMKQNQVAVDWNEFKIMERAFRKWLYFTQNECLSYLNKKYAAELNYERKLKLKCFNKLKHYPEHKKLEEARENRKRKWRQKIKEILPDYRPVDIAENF